MLLLIGFLMMAFVRMNALSCVDSTLPIVNRSILIRIVGQEIDVEAHVD